jgi:hypothetical protein
VADHPDAAGVQLQQPALATDAQSIFQPGLVPGALTRTAQQSAGNLFLGHQELIVRNTPNMALEGAATLHG